MYVLCLMWFVCLWKLCMLVEYYLSTGNSSAGVIRTMSQKLGGLAFCLIVSVISSICLPVGSVETKTRGCLSHSCLSRTRRDTSSATRVFVVRLSDSGELFTVGTMPSNPSDCFQFVDTPPPGLFLDQSTGMISKNSSTQWDSPTTIRFRVTRCADAALGT